MKGYEVRLTILELLKQALPYAMMEQQLHFALNARNPHPIGKLEFYEILHELRDHGAIDTVKGSYGDKSGRWILTKAGELEMAR